MKKCPGCEREIDKYSIACQYCGKLTNVGDQKKESDLLAKRFSNDSSEGFKKRK